MRKVLGSAPWGSGKLLRGRTISGRLRFACEEVRVFRVRCLQNFVGAPLRLPYLIPGGVWYYTEGFLRRKEDQELAGLRTMPA